MAVVLGDTGMQQRVCPIAGMGEQTGSLFQDGLRGAYVAIAEGGQEGLLAVHEGG